MSCPTESPDLTIAVAEGSPPCEIWVQAGGLQVHCGRPSVARLRFRCPCGRACLLFLCDEDLADARRGGLACNGCDGRAWSWNPS